MKIELSQEEKELIKSALLAVAKANGVDKEQMKKLIELSDKFEE